jgi:hypothetical protein
MRLERRNGSIWQGTVPSALRRTLPLVSLFVDWLDIHRHKNTAEQPTEKCNDDDKFIIITTVQQIMTGVQTADSEEDRCAHILRAVYDTCPIKSCNTARTPVPSFPLRKVHRTNHQQVSHRCRLDLFMNPHGIRCLNVTGLLKHSAVVEPVPSLFTFTLKMKAARSSETLLSYRKIIRLHNSEDLDLNIKPASAALFGEEPSSRSLTPDCYFETPHCK